MYFVKKHFKDEPHLVFNEMSTYAAFLSLEFGMQKEANKVRCEILKYSEEHFGHYSKETADAFWSLSSREDGKYLDEVAHILKSIEQTDGTISDIEALAQEYHNEEEYKQEYELRRMVFSYIRKSLGENHTATFDALKQLIQVMKKLGQVDDAGNYYVSVHSGSRHLDKEVAEYYLAEGQKKLKARGEIIPYELTYLTGKLMTKYLHDLQVAQKYAYLNRRIMIEEVSKIMKWKIEEVVDCVHNYVDFRTEMPILRKGAISAQKEEVVLIPINMRDGVIIGKGKGNADWNYSAPHGAGRILKRTEVKNHHTLSEFKTAMKGIYSTSITKNTLDGSPFAYRGLEDIAEAITGTVEIEKVLRPVYNFKSGNLNIMKEFKRD